MYTISNITDIEFIEQKAFEVCDTDGDGGLSWLEVEICVVCISTNKIFKT